MANDLDHEVPQLKVRDLMAPSPVTIQAESSLAQVTETLAEYDVSGLPVVDRGGAVIGVISQTDIVRLRGGSMPTSGWLVGWARRTRGLLRAGQSQEAMAGSRPITVSARVGPATLIGAPFLPWPALPRGSSNWNPRGF